MATVSLKGIRKSYEDHEVVHGIDLDIKDGEFMVFVGPSGCGKSTMMRMIAGLEEITSGELHLGGKLANHLRPVERGVAMVFQSYALYPHMTVYDNMAFGLKLASTPKKEIHAVVSKAAEILHITHLLERRPKALSGGQRQRVAIGRAIVRKPQLFLFDEPLSNLDAGLRVEMRVELSKLHRQLGATMIYVTHDQTEAMTMGDRIAVFNLGCIEQVGTPLELYRRPRNAYVAGFLGSPRINFLDCEVLGIGTGDRKDTCELQIAEKYPLTVKISEFGSARSSDAGIAAGEKLRLGIRPESVDVSAASDGNNGIRGKVELIEFLGDMSLMHVRVGGAEHAMAVKMDPEQMKYAVGQEVCMTPRAGASMLFDSSGNTVAYL